jgi:hypothetical protein
LRDGESSVDLGTIDVGPALAMYSMLRALDA